MSFAQKYFQRVRTFDISIDTKNLNPEIIVIIPVFNEPNVIKTVKSILANKINFQALVIFLINSAKNTSIKIKSQNLKTEKQLNHFINENKSDDINFVVKNVDNLPDKIHGVGLARKIAMDAALKIFDNIDKADGIIVSLDADTTVEENYLRSIKIYFEKNKVCAANIAFEHPTKGCEFEQEIYNAAMVYEIYLRYYVQSLRLVGFPNSYHTIGSAFCVKASTYSSVGGMVMNQSGEDFYFIHKIISSCKYGEIKETKVYPSPRITDRVIFGTGIAINDIINKYHLDYPTYRLEAYEEIGILFKNLKNLYDNKFTILDKIPVIVKSYLEQENYQKRIKEIYDNTSSFDTFQKRFYNWFNALKVLKFLNYSHQKKYIKNRVTEECKKMCKVYYNKDINDNNELLEFMRQIQNNI